MAPWGDVRRRKGFVSVVAAGLFVASCGRSNDDAGDASDAGRGGTGTGSGGVAGARAGADGKSGSGGASGGAGSNTGGTGGIATAGSSGAVNGGLGGASGASDAGTSGEAGDSGEPGGASGGGAGERGEPGVLCSGDVLITNETELAAFRARGCETLDGTLTISSETMGNLDALSPSTLRVITGSLDLVSNPQLSDIQGLAGLTRIEGSLNLDGATVLSDLDGLESLTRLGSGVSVLYVNRNLILRNLDALSNVTELLVDVVVMENPLLTSLAGLHALRSTGAFTVDRNSVLREIDLPELEDFITLSMAENYALETLSLPALEHCQTVSISNNNRLVSISLPVLSEVESVFHVASNASLTTLGSLDALQSVGTLLISANPQLPQCWVDELDMRLQACDGTCTGNDPDATCE